MDFKQLLERAGFNKSKLAKALGLTAKSVSTWRNNPPRYATAYLEIIIELNRYRP